MADAIQYSDNSGDLQKHLSAKMNAWIDQRRRVLVQGMRLFEDDIIDTQLGVIDGVAVSTKRRKATKRTTDFGLRTGYKNLKQSLQAYATPEGARLGVGAKYARIHQFGGDTGRNGATHIPKRLYFYEAWQAEGPKFIYQAINANKKVTI
jgi:phage gpG-like protein